MDTFVFAVGTKKAMARMQKEMQDLVRGGPTSLYIHSAIQTLLTIYKPQAAWVYVLTRLCLCVCLSPE